MASGSPKTPGPSAQETAAADVADAELQRFKTTFAPLTERMIQNVQLTDGERASAAGTAAADVALANRAPRRGFGGGRRIGSGRDVYTRFNRSIGRSVASGAGEAGALLGAENAELGGLRKVAAFGRGLQDDAAAGFRAGAIRGARSAIRDARRSFADRGLRADVVGTGLGFYGSRRNSQEGNK